MKERLGLALGSLSLVIGALASSAPETHGLGLQDVAAPLAAPIEQKYLVDGKEPLAGLSYRFKVGGMPPVMNQGDTPRCVSFSISTVKNWQDRREFGVFFNFNESLFAQRIGTTSTGAYMSVGLTQVQSVGYPVVNVGQAYKHQIRSYWTVPITVADIKRAIATYGPVLVIGWWHDEWWTTQSNGVLRTPRGPPIGGHAYVFYGWDNDRGLRIRNSWGTGWGLNGDGFMPYRFVNTTNVFGVYVTIDELYRAATPPPPPPTPIPTPVPTPVASPVVTEPPAATSSPTAAPTPTLTAVLTAIPSPQLEPDETIQPDPTPDPVVEPEGPKPLTILLLIGALVVLGVLWWRSR